MTFPLTGQMKPSPEIGGGAGMGAAESSGLALGGAGTFRAVISSREGFGGEGTTDARASWTGCEGCADLEA
jgi:hypothetical protein